MYDFYIRMDAFVNQNTLKWRVHHLVKIGVLSRVGRGIYILGQETIFIPAISKKNRQVFSYIARDYPMLQLCLWHTSSLNHFMVHQPARYNLMVEVERYGEESIFYHLKEKFRNVYLNPTEDVYHNYIVEKTDSIIITTLISEAPLQKPYNITVPTIEKILVDIFCDRLLFSAQQGEELDNIWGNALSMYTINTSSLLRYASRRGRKPEIDRFLNKFSNNGDWK